MGEEGIASSQGAVGSLGAQGCEARETAIQRNFQNSVPLLWQKHRRIK